MKEQINYTLKNVGFRNHPIWVTIALTTRWGNPTQLDGLFNTASFVKYSVLVHITLNVKYVVDRLLECFVRIKSLPDAPTHSLTHQSHMAQMSAVPCEIIKHKSYMHKPWTFEPIRFNSALGVEKFITRPDHTVKDDNRVELMCVN